MNYLHSCIMLNKILSSEILSSTSHDTLSFHNHNGLASLEFIDISFRLLVSVPSMFTQLNNT